MRKFLVSILLPVAVLIILKMGWDKFAEYQLGKGYDAERIRIGLPLIRDYKEYSHVFSNGQLIYRSKKALLAKGIKYSFPLKVNEEYDYFILPRGTINMIYNFKPPKWDITYSSNSFDSSWSLSYQSFVDTLNANHIDVFK